MNPIIKAARKLRDLLDELSEKHRNDEGTMK